MNELHERFGAQGLRTVFVVTEDVLERPARAEYCAQVREELDLDVPVVADPTAALEAYGANDLVMLLDEDATVVFKRQGVSLEVVERAIEAELAR